MKFIALASLLLLALFSAPSAFAQSAASGNFVASEACPALQSINKSTNPGNVLLTVGTSYKVVAANKPDPSYYWIVVPGATPDYRWVPVTCGAKDGVAASPAKAVAPAAAASDKAEYVLAISWEPAFCEGQSDKAECKNETAASPEATHFSLHGLWPQPRSKAYCNVSGADQASDKAHNWNALPAVNLSLSTRAALDRAMPGTQSALERHEWIVHGTCSGISADAYFRRAVLFLDTINNSAIGTLFAANIGKRVDGTAIRQAFDTAFGAGAGDRIRLACDRDEDRSLIGEITIGLKGDVTGTGGIGELIAASPKTSPGCNGGIVDPVGLQ